MNIRELTQNAIHDVEKFKVPSISDWVQHIDPILKELGQCGIGSDVVTQLYISGSSKADAILHIGTEYSCCGSYCTHDMDIPMWIICSENPLLVAQAYKLDMDIATLQTVITEDGLSLNAKQERLNSLLERRKSGKP
jgi:hypothetical protein